MTAQEQPGKPAGDYTNREMVAFFLFWSWNLIFLAFMSLGFAPTLLPETFTAVRTGMIPVTYLLYALVLSLIPVACVVLGLTLLRRAPKRLFALGYVVEGPLMLLLAVRFFAIRQATPSVTMLIVITMLGMAAFLWDILNPKGKRLPWLRLAGLTVMALVAVYAAVWLAFYAVPLAVLGLRWIADMLANLPDFFRDFGRSIVDLLRNAPAMIAFSSLGFLLALYTATLFVLTPIAVPLLSLRTWWRAFRSEGLRTGWTRPLLLVAVVVAASAVLFLWANRQPQRSAFAMLETPPASQEQAQELLQRSESIRTGLLNAYLAPFRYVSARGEVVHIRSLYEDALHLPRQRAFAVQDMFESMSSPLLYAPVHPKRVINWAETGALDNEPDEAARLYQQFFDTPIVEAERETIVDAVRSTWSADQAEDAWQAVDEREVYLAQQEVSITPHGDWAEFELHEVYLNQTALNQEAVYYFSLPESAVITGVWLGNNPNKEYAFTYQVAPRGAAQAVYREQTRVQMDPALVEQIGPRQYRLRAFPVPPLTTTYNPTTNRTEVGEAPELHLWLAWQAMSQEGSWPLPRLAEKRNVYWDGDTVRQVTGGQVDFPQDAWLPDSIPSDEPVAASAHRFDLATGHSVLALPAAQVDLPTLPGSLRLAIVLDRSRSMQEFTVEVASALESLKQVLGTQDADMYLTASPYRGEEPVITSLDDLDPGTLLYFGGQNAAQLIAQYDELRGDRTYDAIIVLTDGSGYELGESPVEAPTPDAPVWLVHLGGLPLGYDDGTLEAIQASGGGVAGDVDTALARLAVSLSAQEISGAATDLVDGYLWITLPAESADAAIPSGMPVVNPAADDGFAPFAARRVILAEIQRQRGSLDQLDTLDQLHALAMEYSIVTPYSSMIVLVNTQQQMLLEQLSELGDRYNREVEAIGETKPAAPVPLTGVPEPHEWLLLGLAATFLVYIGYTKRAELARANQSTGGLRLR